jgi:Ion transport protein
MAMLGSKIILMPTLPCSLASFYRMNGGHSSSSTATRGTSTTSTLSNADSVGPLPSLRQESEPVNLYASRTTSLSGHTVTTLSSEQVQGKQPQDPPAPQEQIQYSPNPQEPQPPAPITVNSASSSTGTSMNQSTNDWWSLSSLKSSTCWKTVRHVQTQAGFIVNHPTTQWIIILLIASNAILMGIATFGFVKDNEHVAKAFGITDNVFLVLFTIELSLQFLYHGWYLLSDAWLVFDLLIVVTSWVLSEWQIIRALRIFRALRLITRIKVMQNLVVGTYTTV